MISFALALIGSLSEERVKTEATTVRSMAAKSAENAYPSGVRRFPHRLCQVAISHKVIDPTNPKTILSQFDVSAYDSVDKTGSGSIHVAEVTSTRHNRKTSVGRQNSQLIRTQNSYLSDTSTVRRRRARVVNHAPEEDDKSGEMSPKLSTSLPSRHLTRHSASLASVPVFASNSSLQLGRRYNDFLLTAYAISPRDTGKEPDSPQYGITYSGTRAKPGRTVAVDPHVIPIGTMLWIEGIGIRYAEDIGGAIKGNHIDVLLKSDDDALRFGVKRHVRIYTLRKPSQVDMAEREAAH